MDNGAAREQIKAGDSIYPLIQGICFTLMNIALVAIVLSAGYLLFGLMSGQLAGYDSLPKPDRLRVLANIRLAQTVLGTGLIAASLLAAVALWKEEFTGYAIALGAALVGFGIPFAFAFFGTTKENSPSIAYRTALGVFASVYLPPLCIGGFLIVKDIISKTIKAFQNKEVNQAGLTYGAGAQTTQKPIRLSLFAKCWEGPYCREFIRVHCPIFTARKACWKERRGCYCEEDIVSYAAAKVQGAQLQMAPDARYNFANPATSGVVNVGGSNPNQAPRKPQLSDHQKRERCNNCIIYNEHLREKYRILLPVTIIVSTLICAALAPFMRQYVSVAFGAIEQVFSRLAFGSGAVKFERPSGTAEWFFVGALSIMVISKSLQTLEWMIFKLKI